MALDYDFYLTSGTTSLGFNLAVSKDHPYERATAQFRKEQVDQQSTVGDQSLTGWWTRGQLSFHKGAGEKYYEVLDGETVLHRFKASNAVDVFTPGEVSITPAWADLTILAQDAVAVSQGGLDLSGVYATTTAGVVWASMYGGTSAARATSTGAAPGALTSSDYYYYVVNGAKIERQTSWTTGTPTPSTVRITLSGGATWRKIWWAKDRLWAIDTDGYFYALADTVATVTNADAFWNSGHGGPGWSLTESPGAVLISKGDTIYSITVDTSGLLPTIASPTVSAKVPGGESISCIDYYLGYVVATTNLGVRVGLVQDDKVVLGAMSITGEFSQTWRVAGWGTLVYVVGNPDGHYGYEGHLESMVCAIDLSQQVDDTTFAWSPLSFLGLTVAAPSGVTVDPSGRPYVFRATGHSLLTADDALASSGSIQTAYHRLGTLDEKRFVSVTVRTGGAGGHVDVSLVADDGTITSLGTVAAPGVATLPIGVSAERIALKFTLALGGTNAPTLLGYQIRALPAPVRQRLIRVPLMLFDSEQNRTGQKTGGDPVARRAALEALEESNAVVTFEDNVSGETGTAYIEAVEVSQTTPAGRGKPGGLLYVTLRKLS